MNGHGVFNARQKTISMVVETLRLISLYVGWDGMGWDGMGKRKSGSRTRRGFLVIKGHYYLNYGNLRFY